MGVVISSVVSSLVFCIIFILLIYGRCGFSFDVSLIKKLFKYTWPLWVAGGVSLIIHSSNRFFIRSYWGLEDVGLFELAVRFSAILGILVWQPFSHWWQTERFRILKHLEENPAQYQLVFDTVTTVMVFFGAAIAILSGPVIVLMSAKEFHGAITAVAPLTYSVLFLKFGMFMNFCFLASDKTIVISYLKYIAAVTNVALLLLFIPDYGFVGAAYAVLIANFLLFLITYFWGKRSLDLGVGLGFLFKSLFLLAGVTLIDSLLLAQAPFIMGLVYKFALLTLYLVISVYLLHQNKPTSHLVSAAFEKVKLRFL